MRKKELIDGHELLTPGEVAQIMRVDDTTVRRWINQGTLDAVILPGRGPRLLYRVKREVVNRILNNGA